MLRRATHSVAPGGSLEGKRRQNTKVECMHVCITLLIEASLDFLEGK